MKKLTKVKIYGSCKSSINQEHFFDGEIVSIDEVAEPKVIFSYQGQTYTAHQRQTEAVKLLYPNALYVKDGKAMDQVNDAENLVVATAEISNCYARQGGHWIRYIIDPDSLVLQGEDNEELAQAKARAVADLIVSKDRLVKIFKEQNLAITDEQIEAIVLSI